MVAKKQTTGHPQGAAPEPPAGAGTGEKTDKGEQQGTQSADSGTTAKRKAWVKKTPIEIILEQVGKQEQKVADLKKELDKEENELQKMHEATKLLGG